MRAAAPIYWKERCELSSVYWIKFHCDGYKKSAVSVILFIQSQPDNKTKTQLFRSKAD